MGGWSRWVSQEYLGNSEYSRAKRRIQTNERVRTDLKRQKERATLRAGKPITDAKKVLIFFVIFGFIGLEIGGATSGAADKYIGVI
jgi:hypothetical protein